MNRYVGNLPPMPGVFPDYPAPVVRNAGAGRELAMMRWGMPPPPRAGGYGQKRDTVNMANLVYQNTVDETVYDKLSSRMKDRYDLLGSLPDVIDDEWIDNVEAFEEGLREFTRKKKNTADVFELRYGNFLQDDGSSWQLCEQVLDRDEADKLLSTGW